MKRHIPRILLTAPASGSGKTLITCGILQALVNRGMKVASYKCGPDYIDPMFHGRVIGTRSRNLDTFFTDTETTRYLFAENASDCDIAVTELGVKVLGYVPKLTDLNLESRHLGLVLPGEIEALKEKLNRLAAVLEETLDLDAFCTLAEDTEELAIQVPEIPVLEAPEKIRLAVAADDAFCFTYQDNLKLLETMGAELVFFSPLQDKKLPEEVDGMILSGGYPELHAKTLSENHSMRETIRKAIEDGMPCIAECGGFLYLHRELEGQDGVFYPMAGVLDAKAYRTDRLGRFGYITLTAEEDQLLGKAGMEIRGHEFHYWDSEQCGKSFHAKKPVGKREWDCVNSSKSLYAGFPHLFFWSNPEAAYEFLKKCEEYHGC